MSAGEFTTSKYQATYDAAAVHPIRVQPETIAAAIGATTNAPPPEAVTNPISARVTLTRRELGLRARYVTLQASTTVADVPDGYKPGGITRIPSLDDAFYAAAIKGATCTYLTKPFTVINREPERAQ